MSRELLKNVSVRIIVKKNNITLKGSGVIARNIRNEFYIITAEHCINGKKEKRLSNVSVDDINIEYKYNNEETFKKIEVCKISYSCKDQDIAALLIKSDNFDCENTIYCEFIGDMNRVPFYFRGFPKWLEDKAKTYDCQIEEPDTLKFHIKSDEIKDLSLSKTIEKTSNGLSGSGVFCIKNGKIFLLGIVTNLRDNTGTFGHVCCKKLNGIYENLNFKTELISGGLSELNKWKEIDKKHVTSMIQDLKEANLKEFERLERKLKILYDEADIEEMLDIFLTDYFNAQVNINEISKYNTFIKEAFENARMQLSRNIKKSFNKRLVNNPSEAQDIYTKVVEAFISILKNEKVGEIEGNNLTKMSDRATVGLLLDCELDFIQA